MGPESDISLGYRTQAELDHWMSKCPIALMEKRVLNSEYPDLKSKLTAEIEEEIKSAFEFASASPYPSPEEILEDVYADSN